MKKRWMAILLTAVMTAQIVAVAPSAAESTAAVNSTDSSITGTEEAQTEVGDVTFEADSVQYEVTAIAETSVFVEVTGIDGNSVPSDLVIPASVDYEGKTYHVKAIADDAFAGCGSVKTLTIPSSVETIGSGSMLSSLEKITIAGDNSNFYVKDGVLFEKKGTGNELVLYPSGSSAIAYTVPSDTAEIRSDAFYGVKNLLNIVIPSSVQTIEKNAFLQFASGVAVAFDTDTAPTGVAASAFSLNAAGNKFYFKNETVLAALKGAGFAGTSDAEYSSDGIPDSILKSSSAAVSSSSLLKDADTTAAIADGYYMIQSGTGDYALDIAAGIGSTVKNANVDIYQNDGRDSEIFSVKSIGDGLYAITAFCSGMSLDIAAGQDADKTNVAQYPSNGTGAQKFYLEESDEDGYYTIRPSYSQRVLDVTGGAANVKNGQNVWLYHQNGTTAQQWKFVSVQDPTEGALSAGIYTIRSKLASNRSVDVEAGSTKSGANVWLYNYNGTNAQKYLVIPTGSGNNYYILNAYSRRALDVQRGGTVDKTNVWSYRENDSDAQTWKIKLNSDGYYSIISAKSGLCLDVAAGKDENKANIQIYHSNGTDAQRWSFEASTVTLDNGMFNISSAMNAKSVIDIKAGSIEKGASAQIYLNNGTAAQIFSLVNKDSEGYYNLKNIRSGLMLGTGESAMEDGALLAQYAADSSDSQKFKPVETGDSRNSYYLETKNGLYVSISGHTTTSGAKIYLSTAGDTNAEKWYFAGTQIPDGWQIIDGTEHYYVNGSPAKSRWVGKVYFGADGVMWDGWHEAVSNNGKFTKGYYYYFNGRSGAVTDARPYLKALFGVKKSKTQNKDCPKCDYYITVDRTEYCQVTVYTKYPGSSSWNLPIFAFLCSPGREDSEQYTPTDAGSRKTLTGGRWQELMGPSFGQYATCVLLPSGSGWTNNGEYFHSVACPEPNTYNLDASTYDKLGTRQSHGCIRVSVRNAFWIWEYCPNNTPVFVGDSLARPIERLPQPFMVYNQWIDPTDPQYTGNYGYEDDGNFYNAIGGFH